VLVYLLEIFNKIICLEQQINIASAFTHIRVLILACNWLHYVDKNFVFQNMEISSQKISFIPRKINLDMYID
jgi:hypothetical protein